MDDVDYEHWAREAKRLAAHAVDDQLHLTDQDVEDIAQYAMKQFVGETRVRPVRKPYGYLNMVIRRRAMRLNTQAASRIEHAAPALADKKGEVDSDWRLVAQGPSPSEQVIGGEAADLQRGLFELVVAILPEQDQRLVLDRFQGSLPFAEIAQELGQANHQVAENRMRTVIRQAEIAMEVIRRMPPSYAMPVVESVRAANGEVETQLALARAHLAAATSASSGMISDIEMMLGALEEAVKPRRGRPGLHDHVARHLVAGAAHYVHLVDDISPDFDHGYGFEDDWIVVRSVCRGLDLEVFGPSFTPMADIGEFLG